MKSMLAEYFPLHKSSLSWGLNWRLTEPVILPSQSYSKGTLGCLLELMRVRF